ncbi:MAG TPA: winged helix family transcriptional regulator [Anaerolineae bacterium]|nr:winged helix family transcriptional regulator [Anaerolineae bacterium]
MADPTSSHQQTKTLATWLKGHGFTENPFALREAGREERLSEYFVEGPYYDEIKGEANDPRTAFVFAARGCGKSAYRVMIQRSCRPDDRASPVLAVPYTDFNRVLTETNGDLSQVTVDHHLRAILAAGLTTLLREFVESPQSFLRLSQKRQGIFKTLMVEHAPLLLHPTFLSDRLREWGKEAAADLLEEAAEQELPDTLLASTSEPLPRLLHTLLAEPSEPLPAGLPLIEHWRALVALIRRTGLKAVYVLVDGLDEFSETAVDPQTAVTTFLLPLITNLSLMETPSVAFKFFLPLEVFDTWQKNPVVRFDRLERHHLEWRDEHLVRMLRSRLQAFSQGRVPSLDAIADVDVAGRIDGQLVKWAYGSPRNLLLLGDILLTVHCDQDGEGKPLLTEEDLQKALDCFEREYGPLVPLLSIDEKQQKVLIGGRPIREKLSSLEYKLLWFLYQNAGEVKSKDDVYLAVYQTTEGVSDETIDSLVFRLRRKIEPDPRNPAYLVTQRGRGYRLMNVE